MPLHEKTMIAQPGYVYIFEGVDYSPAEAEPEARQLGNIEGWSWRRSIY